MSDLSSAFPEQLLPRIEQLTVADRKDVEWILDAAEAWSQGMPIEEFARVGQIVSPRSGHESTSYSRWVAMVSTPVLDPRRKHLRAAIDELLRFQGFQLTNFGLFDRETLASFGTTVRGWSRGT